MHTFTLDKHMHYTEVISNHTAKGNMRHFTSRCGTGVPWPLFIEPGLRSLFAEFVPGRNVAFEMSKGVAAIKTALGSDWSEHSR